MATNASEGGYPSPASTIDDHDDDDEILFVQDATANKIIAHLGDNEETVSIGPLIETPVDTPVECGDNADNEASTQCRMSIRPPRFLQPPFLLASLLLAFVWFANALVYYGLNLNASQLPANVYIVTVLLNFVSIPGQLIAIPMATRFGYRKALLGGMLGVGAVFLLMSTIRYFERVVPYAGPIVTSISIAGM